MPQKECVRVGPGICAYHIAVALCRREMKCRALVIVGSVDRRALGDEELDLSEVTLARARTHPAQAYGISVKWHTARQG